MTIYRLSFVMDAESRINDKRAFEDIAVENDYTPHTELYSESKDEIMAEFNRLRSEIRPASKHHYVVTVYRFDFCTVECAVDCDDDDDLRCAFTTGWTSSVDAVAVSDPAVY